MQKPVKATLMDARPVAVTAMIHNGCTSNARAVLNRENHTGDQPDGSLYVPPIGGDDVDARAQCHNAKIISAEMVRFKAVGAPDFVKTIQLLQRVPS